MGVGADARVVRVRHSGRALRWLRGRHRSFRRNSSASSDKRSGNESVANPPITDTTTPAVPHRMGGTQSIRRKSPIKRAGARRPCRFGVAAACAGCGTRRTEATTRNLPDKHGGSLVQRVWALRANACVRMHAHARVLRAACARVCVRLCARACVCVCICACVRTSLRNRDGDVLPKRDGYVRADAVGEEQVPAAKSYRTPERKLPEVSGTVPAKLRQASRAHAAVPGQADRGVKHPRDEPRGADHHHTAAVPEPYPLSSAYWWSG